MVLFKDIQKKSMLRNIEKEVKILYELKEHVLRSEIRDKYAEEAFYEPNLQKIKGIDFDSKWSNMGKAEKRVSDVQIDAV